MHNGFDASKLFSVSADFFQTARHRLLKIIGLLQNLLLCSMCFIFLNWDVISPIKFWLKPAIK